MVAAVTLNDIVSQMRSALSLSEPDLDTTIGTPTRKIIDVVGETIAEAYVDKYLLEYQYDIDAKSDADLDEFVRLFGFTRFPAKRASGMVTFERTTASPADILIPVGSQITSTGGSSVVVQTVTPALLVTGETSIDIPVQALVGGTTGNVPANSLRFRVSPLAGISSFTNTVALTGGADAESDDQLRSRFIRTIFRNMAGTECQPPGTLVLVPRAGRHQRVQMEYVPIESLAEGDKVVSWGSGTLLRRGRTVQGITSRDYSGHLVVVRTEDGRVSKYTPNHRCLVKIGPALAGKHYVYMQRRGTSFRIGKTSEGRYDREGRVCNASGIAGLMISQGSDEAWVLSVHDTASEALVAEKYAAWQFNIPTSLFRATVRQGDLIQEGLDVFWRKVGDLTAQAEGCLSSFGRMIEHPLVKKGTRSLWSRATEVRACNLLDGTELIDADAVVGSSQQFDVRYVPAQVTSEFYEGPVWSLDVDGPHTYISDGFATHNSMFLATALNDPDVAIANVLGAIETYRESVEVVGGTVTSTIINARYVYPDSQFFGANIDGGDILTPGVHYTMSTNVPPVVTITDPITAPDGVYELQFEYVPQASRNDPLNGVTNRVDVYVTGTRATEATEMLVFRSARIFDTTVGSPLNRDNFQRIDASKPMAGNYFITLSMSPVIDPSSADTIIIGGVTYNEGIDYFLVNDATRTGGAPGSLSGVEFLSTANGQTKAIPADGLTFQVDYIFNAIPRDVETAIREWRLITTDVRVHQAKPVYLDLHFALMYSTGYSEASVRPNLEGNLATYIAGLGFNAVVQVSDLLEVAHQTQGIDAVRFLTSSDNATAYAIQKVSAADTLLITYATNVAGQIRRAFDVQVSDDEYPTLNSVTMVTKARNTFGAV